MKIEIEFSAEDVRGVLEHSHITWGTLGNFGAVLPAVAVHKTSGDKYQDQTVPLDLERGLRMMLTWNAAFPMHCAGRHPAQWNNEMCDAFVQYAAFGELRYV